MHVAKPRRLNLSRTKTAPKLNPRIIAIGLLHSSSLLSTAYTEIRFGTFVESSLVLSMSHILRLMTRIAIEKIVMAKKHRIV
jgi:hypothetical protein